MRRSNAIGKLMRVGRRASPVILALAAPGGVALFLNLDRMARRTVETQTSSALNLRTTVESVALHPLSDKVGFSDFRIASPAGFPTPDLLIVPRAEMTIAFSEFRNDLVHIKSITLTNPRLVIEGDGTDFNLKRMVERIPRALHPVHLIIDRVIVRDATVVLRNLPGIHREVTVQVESFTVDGIGADHPGGALIKEAVTHLVASLAAHAGDSPQMPAQYRAFVKGDFGQIVRSTIPGPVGRVLSGLLGSHEDPGPAGTKSPGLFGLGRFLGRGRAAATRPNE